MIYRVHFTREVVKYYTEKYTVEVEVDDDIRLDEAEDQALDLLEYCPDSYWSGEYRNATEHDGFEHDYTERVGS